MKEKMGVSKSNLLSGHNGEANVIIYLVGITIDPILKGGGLRVRLSNRRKSGF
jgi:hypothetical protein